MAGVPSVDPVGASLRPRANLDFMLRHPAHWIALGFGSGLAPVAPGTVGTLWAWISFLLFSRWLGDAGWAAMLCASAAVGWWSCTVTARNLGVGDPGEIVWDEVLAFWIVLWLSMPTSLADQAIAFALFRFFDAAKPGPVRWADRLFKPRGDRAIGFAAGFGILFDDLVAALCTLLAIAAWRWAMP